MDYAVTLYVRVTDEAALIKKAQELESLPDDIFVDVALRILLDRNELLDGAEIQDSVCEAIPPLPEMKTEEDE